MIFRNLYPRNLSFGGFSVKRYLPSREIRNVGPWVFFDHFGQHEFMPGKGIDVIPHPHINLGTVTYLFEGEIIHRDSLGSFQAIRPGEVNLMIAGKGIAHSERTDPEIRLKGHTLHGIQLWHALPEEHEEEKPSFIHYSSAEIPEKSENGIKTRVIIGRMAGLESPVKAYGETLYAEILMPAGSELSADIECEESGIYLVSGKMIAGGQAAQEGSFLVCGENPGKIKAVTDSRIIIIGGKSPGKRYIWWNFVSSRKERIKEAGEEWQKMAYGRVAGDESEAAPLPDSDSFSLMD